MAESGDYEEKELFMTITVANEETAVLIATRLAAGVFVSKNTMQASLNNYLYPASSSPLVEVTWKSYVRLNNDPLAYAPAEGIQIDWWAANDLANCDVLIAFQIEIHGYGASRSTT